MIIHLFQNINEEIVLKMRTIARILLYDVLLALVYIACDAYLAYFYFSQDHFWWGLLTLLAVALPGTLGL